MIDVLDKFDIYLEEKGLSFECIVIGGAALIHLGIVTRRTDLLKTKLFACCDRDEDFDDCLALKPTESELAKAISWVKFRDTNELWPDHVEKVFGRLKKELGHE